MGLLENVLKVNGVNLYSAWRPARTLFLGHVFIFKAFKQVFSSSPFLSSRISPPSSAQHLIVYADVSNRAVKMKFLNENPDTSA